MTLVNSPLKLGILGGLGPMASAYFLEMITEHTKASCDQDHIDILLSSRASTPDRTDYIMGKSKISPLPVMIEDAKYLESCKVAAIVIPCNTAHYFIKEVRRSVSIPMPSIITETVHHIKNCGARRAGILATEGTISTGSYQMELERAGIAWEVPTEDEQKQITHIIYDLVKKGVKVSPDELSAVTSPLFERGCDTVILGCTELSVANRDCNNDARLTDSLEVLAYTAIKLCGKEPVGFNDTFNY